MSHMTVYVHMLTSRTLGDLQGPGRFHANRFYTRLQTAGGSKDSNDTASTFFDFLHGARNTDIRPPIYRTGYGPEGRIEGESATWRSKAGSAAYARATVETAVHDLVAAVEEAASRS